MSVCHKLIPAAAALFSGLACMAAVTEGQLKEAASAYDARNWAEAARRYDVITKTEPNNGRAWYRKGVSLYSLHDYPAALESLQQAVVISQHPTVMYALARVYATLKQPNEALNWLEKAVDAGYSDPKGLQEDAELASLHGERFDKVLATITRNANPCSAPEYHQFDFWVGEWNVFAAGSETQVGTSSVQSILGACVVFENWTGTGGGQGKSFNKYHPFLKRWEQYWVDGGPDRMFFTGHFADGALRFETDGFTPSGKPVKRKLTFFNRSDGTVRQFSEISYDGGASWANEYDFIYKRKPPKP